jgi:hypothetical protein
MYKNRKQAYISKLIPSITITFAIANQVFLNSSSANSIMFDEFKASYIPCYAIAICSFFSAPLVVFSLMLRSVQFTIIYNLNQRNTISTGINSFEKPFYSMLRFFLKRNANNSNNTKLSVHQGELTTEASEASGESHSYGIERISDVTFFKSVAVLQFILAIILGLTLRNYPAIFSYQKVCPGIQSFVPFLGFIIFTVFTPYLLYINRKFTDTLGVNTMIKMTLFLFQLSILPAVISLLYSPLIVVLQPFTSVFLAISSILVHTINIVYPLNRMYRSEKRVEFKYNEAMFLHILDTPNLYERFKEYVAKELATENLLFYEEYKGLTQKFDLKLFFLNTTFFKFAKTRNDKSLMKPTLNRIYKKFIQRNAPNELNIPSECSKAIKQSIEEQTYDIKLLEPVMEEVLRMLYVNSFGRFFRELESENFNITAETVDKPKDVTKLRAVASVASRPL